MRSKSSSGPQTRMDCSSDFVVKMKSNVSRMLWSFTYINIYRWNKQFSGWRNRWIGKHKSIGLQVWRKLQTGEITTFMGVPTMYSHLLTVFGKMKPEEKQRCRDAAAALRLTVCGSAACPLPIMQAWKELSGTVRQSQWCPVLQFSEFNKLFFLDILTQ